MTTIWFSHLNSEEKDSREFPFTPEENRVSSLFGKPIEIGYFSVDAKRTILFNKSRLKYLVSPLKTRDLHLNLNLNLDVEARYELYVTLGRMHRTLYWLLNKKQILSSQNRILQTNYDFVTVRGTLKLISCTPYLKGYTHREEWEICASKFGGTIYLSAIDTDAEIKKEETKSYRQARLEAWGYKFEQLMTSDTVDGECNAKSTTFQHEEYCIILKSIFDKYSVLYTAEIDAVIPARYPGPGSGNTSCYTELKTSSFLVNEVQKYHFYRYKIMSWWAQSFFSGIPEIICGLRDNEGIVKELEILSVSKIPEKAIGMWSSDVCLNFCVKFLDFLKRTVIEDDANVVYKFHYQGGDTIYCKKIINPNSRYRVIPEWYVKEEKDLDIKV